MTAGNQWLSCKFTRRRRSTVPLPRLLATRISDGVKAGDVHRKGTRLYKVLWQGFGEEEATWEPKSKLPAELVASFESEREPSPSKRARQPSEAASPSARSPPSKR